MHNERKEDGRILTAARRGLHLDAPEAFGDPAERARRVNFYARQITDTGRIRAWAPRVEPHEGHQHGRFAFGDALLRHQAG